MMENALSDWLQLLGGGILLYLGAEWLVAGATTLAFALQVPGLLVGLTVLAYGTSASRNHRGHRSRGDGPR